jgi:hypothetical protein
MAGLSAVIPLLLTILLGWSLRRRDYLKEETTQQLLWLLYWVSLPALLFRRTVAVGAETLLNGNLFLVIHIAFFFMPPLAWLLARLCGESRSRSAVSTLVSIRSNNVYMGLPVVALALGPDGVAALSLYLAMGLFSYNLLSIGWAQIVLSGGLSRKDLVETARSVLRNPLFLACFAGIGAAFLGLKELPLWLDSFLKILSDLATALALIALGASLRIGRPLAVLRSAWRDVLIRLFLHPALMVGLFRLFPVEPVLASAVVLATAMPAAVNNFIVAKGMDMDSEYAGEVVAATTVLSLITIPLWIGWVA